MVAQHRFFPFVSVRCWRKLGAEEENDMLTEQQDAYGRIVWDHLHGKPSAEIIERDDGWFGMSGGAPNYFAEFKDWPRHQQVAMQFVRGRVLDVGCGAGRCCLDRKSTRLNSSH